MTGENVQFLDCLWPWNKVKQSLSCSKSYPCYYSVTKWRGLIVVTQFSSHSSSADCSRLRLAAACGIIKIAQEPHYIECIKLENFQRLSLVMQVRWCKSMIFWTVYNKTLSVISRNCDKIRWMLFCFRERAEEFFIPFKACLCEQLYQMRSYRPVVWFVCDAWCYLMHLWNKTWMFNWMHLMCLRKQTVFWKDCSQPSADLW